MFKYTLVVLVVLSISYLAQCSADWENYKAKFGKKYSNPVEETRRRALFEESVRRIQRHLESGNGQKFQIGLNEFSDWTPSELQSLRGLKKASPEQVKASSESPEAKKFIQSILAKVGDNVPAEVDWRTEEGFVTPVKNQKTCGSCWAFATTGCLEGQQKRLGLNLTQLSEQQLMDCSKQNKGCQGGIMFTAMSYIREQGGIEDQKSYPYVARNGKCKFNKDKVVMTDVGGAILAPEDETLLKIVVAGYGPVAVAIAADQQFQDYDGGIYDNPDNMEDLNHGVLIVGYGTEKKNDFWIVKNSWGPEWGEKGYIRMARNKRNQNGIASEPTVAIF